MQDSTHKIVVPSR